MADMNNVDDSSVTFSWTGGDIDGDAVSYYIYLATFEATKKWTMPIRNWGKVRGELSIMYSGRLSD